MKRIAPAHACTGLIALLLVSFLAGKCHAQLEEAAALDRRVRELHQAGSDREAIPLAQRSLELREMALHRDDPRLGPSLNNLAELYRSQGLYGEAEPLYKRSLAIAETALGAGHPIVGLSLNNLAKLYEEQGRYDDAERLYKRSLAIFEKGLDHPRLGLSLNNLAALYLAQGRYAEAEPLLKRSLAIYETALGRDHPELGNSLNNLAGFYHNQGRYAEAEPLLKRSLAIYETALGGGHPRVGLSLNNLAELYRAQGRYDEAEPLYKRSLAIYESALGPNHSDVGTSLNNLALLFHSQGRYDEAEPLYKRSLAIREGTLGPNHPDVAATLNNLAGLHESQVRYGEAEPLYKRSLAIREGTLGPNHSDVGNSLNNLAGLYYAQGRYGEAEPLLKRSLVIYETALGGDHPEVGLSLNNLAELYRRTDRPEEAAGIEKRLAGMPPPGTRHLQVHFATNRKEIAAGSPANVISFGAEEANLLTLGHAVVRMPETELRQLAKRREDGFGALHRSRGELTPAEKLKIVHMKSLDNTQFTTSVTETLGRAGLYKGQTLVFVHGYNVDFEEAVKRAAQIAFDLEFDGLIVAFAWPSQRRLTQYLSDTASADVAVDFLIKFVDMLAERLPGAKVHFIAHSMGNVVLLRALERIAERRGAGPQTSLGELILAHADVEATRCAQLIRNVRPAVAGITLYVNTSDWALWASEKLSTKGRCGAMARVYEGADTIDTTGLNAMGDRWPADSIFLPVLKNLVAVRTEGLNHDAFVRVPLLFGEITRLLLTGMRPPDKRTTDLAQVKNNEGKIYWRFDKARLVAQMPAADKVLETGADPTTK